VDYHTLLFSESAIGFSDVVGPLIGMEVQIPLWNGHSLLVEPSYAGMYINGSSLGGFGSPFFSLVTAYQIVPHTPIEWGVDVCARLQVIDLHFGNGDSKTTVLGFAVRWHTS